MLEIYYVKQLRETSGKNCKPDLYNETDLPKPDTVDPQLPATPYSQDKPCTKTHHADLSSS